MQETEPLVAVHFSFGTHVLEDVPRFPNIKAEAETFFLKDPRALNVYFHEEIAVFNSITRLIPRLTEETGSYLDATIVAMMQVIGKPIKSTRELHNYRSMSLNANNDGVFPYHELAMLDELAKVVRFELEYESYPHDEAMKMFKGRQRFNDRMQTSEQLQRAGRLEDALKLDLEATQIQAANLKFRNQYYLNRLADRIIQGFRSKRPTRLFVRIGENHDALVNRLRVNPRIRENVPEISYNYDEGQALLLPAHEVLLFLEANLHASIDRDKLIRAMISGDLDSLLDQRNQSRVIRTQRINNVLASKTADELEKLVKSFPVNGYETSLLSLLY